MLTVFLFIMNSSIAAFQDYLQKEKKYSQHTVKAYCGDVLEFHVFNTAEFDDDNIVGVAYGQIRSWIVLLVDGGLSNTSVNRKVASLKAFYRFLLKSKQITVSPLVKHKVLKASKILQIPFSEKEIVNALNVEIGSGSFEIVRNKLIVDLFYATGMRRAELIGLRYANVDLFNNTIKVLGKRNKERILPILPVIMDQFSRYIEERSHLELISDEDSFFI